MHRCNTCGGNTLFLGNDTYRCLYCGNEYNMVNSTPVCVSKASTVRPEKKDNGVDVFEMNVDGVLEIEWSDNQYKHSGSGFLIGNDGYALTNTHVVTHEDGRSCGQVNVRIKGQQVRASVVKLGDNKHGSGGGIDLALIKLDRLPLNAKVLKFEKFDNVRIGERVFVIGNSLGYGTCITSGIVSDKCREVDGQMLLMTDCAVNGGNSGGPIFNDKGLVIGVIVSGITGAEGMNFAIPSKDAINFIANKVSISKANLITKATKYSTPALAPCPKCGSWNTNVENGIFYCESCGFEGG